MTINGTDRVFYDYIERKLKSITVPPFSSIREKHVPWYRNNVTSGERRLAKIVDYLIFISSRLFFFNIAKVKIGDLIGLEMKFTYGNVETNYSMMHRRVDKDLCPTGVDTPWGEDTIYHKFKKPYGYNICKNGAISHSTYTDFYKGSDGLRKPDRVETLDKEYKLG